MPGQGRYKAPIAIIGIIWGILLLSGCQSAYYSAMETVGIEKREILSSRVEKARDAQQDAEQQFVSSQQQLAEMIGFEGGDLEKVYSRLSDEYEQSKDAAESVTDRIDSVEDVAMDLFAEWERELDIYESGKLRQASAAKLQTTRQQYTTLIQAMRQAEARMPPVLGALQDNVLYLKHNLNASTISGLEQEYRDISREIDQLVAEMQDAIQASNVFLAQLQL